LHQDDEHCDERCVATDAPHASRATPHPRLRQARLRRGRRL